MTAREDLAIRNVLVATDFSSYSDQAVRAAFALARHFGAALHLLHVAPRAPDRAAALDRLGAIAEAHADGVRFTASVAIGRPAPEIVRYASREQMDLIVVGTHGRTGLRHAVLGSVAEAVLRTALCQVLAIPLHAKTADAPAQPAAVPDGAGADGHCLVCARPAAERICETCAARIRGEALERLLDDEKAGRRATTV